MVCLDLELAFAHVLPPPSPEIRITGSKRTVDAHGHGLPARVAP